MIFIILMDMEKIMILINIEIAKNIWRDKLRLLRAPLLSKLDIDFLRAIEINNINEQQRIIALKQRLRDAPNDPRIDAATSVQELILINPIENLGI